MLKFVAPTECFITILTSHEKVSVEASSMEETVTKSINLVYLKLIVNVADPDSTERIEHAHARNPITMISPGKSILR